MIISPTWLIISAIATLTLAVAAFMAIRKTSTIQKEGRRQSLLNEIIEWARDVLECGTSDGVKDTFKDLFGVAKTANLFNLYRLTNIIELEGSFAGALRRSLYYSKVAQGLKSDNLSKAVEKLRQLLQTHLDTLEEWEKTFPKNLNELDEAKYDESNNKTLESLHTLRASAQILIAEATEMKIRLAG